MGGTGLRRSRPCRAIAPHWARRPDRSRWPVVAGNGLALLKCETEDGGKEAERRRISTANEKREDGLELGRMSWNWGDGREVEG